MERIDERQVAMITINIILAIGVVSLPSQLLQAAGQDVWLAFPLAAAPVLLTLWCLAKVSGRFPEQGLFRVMVDRFPVMGRVLVMLYVAMFWLIFVRDVRLLTDSVSVILLPQTPLVVTSFLIAFTAAAIARGGMEILGRMTEVFGGALIVVVLLIPVVTLKQAQARFLQPVLADGLLPPIHAFWYLIANLGEIVLLPFVISGRPFRFRYGATGLAVGAGLLLVMVLLSLLVMGPRVSARFIYPVYELVRHIRLTDFIDRFDLLLVGLWMPAMLTRVAYNLFAAIHGLQQVWPALSAPLLALPVGALGWTCSLWFFVSAQQVFHLSRVWPTLAVPLQILLPVLLFFWLRPRRRAALADGSA